MVCLWFILWEFHLVRRIRRRFTCPWSRWVKFRCGGRFELRLSKTIQFDSFMIITGCFFRALSIHWSWSLSSKLMELSRIFFRLLLDQIPLLEEFNNVNSIKVPFHSLKKEFLVFCWFETRAETEFLFQFRRHSFYCLKDVKSDNVYLFQI